MSKILISETNLQAVIESAGRFGLAPEELADVLSQVQVTWEWGSPNDAQVEVSPESLRRAALAEAQGRLLAMRFAKPN